MRKTSLFFSGALVMAFAIVSCKKESNGPEDNDNEVITTVEARVTEQGTSNTQVFKWEDLDGIGGNNPVIETIVLDAHKTYDVELALLDKTKSPASDVTEEIAEENEVHRFYFTPSAGLELVVEGFDLDDAGAPLGIQSEWSAGAAGNGTIQILLRHYPNGGKDASDPATSGKSSTDADAVFPVEIR